MGDTCLCLDSNSLKGPYSRRGYVTRRVWITFHRLVIRISNVIFYSLIQTQCTLPLKQFRSASLVMMSTVSIVDVPFFS